MRTKCVGLPGAFNGLVARAVRATGFEGAYVSGAAVSASFGVPDVGLLTLNEFCNVIEQVARASGLPVIADADTGFGEAEMTVRTVHEYSRAGAAGFHIEDQVFPKRCGHLDGKSLVPIDHMQEKVSRSAAARDDCSGGAFIVCARTDARSVEGLEPAIERAKAYIDAGADMIFPEGLPTEEDFHAFADAMKAYSERTFLLANMTEFGKTPLIPLDRFGELGYSCVIWPVSSLRTTMGAVTRLFEAIARDGTVEAELGAMQERKDLYALLGYEPGVEWRFPGR